MNYRFVRAPYFLTLNLLAFCVGLVLASTSTAFAQQEVCSRVSADVPAGLSALQMPSHLDRSPTGYVTCSDTEPHLYLGDGNRNTLIYPWAFQSVGGRWVPIELSADAQRGPWLVGRARGTLAPYEGTEQLLGFLCHKVDDEWQCGCGEAACARPSWQLLELVSEPDFSTNRRVDLPPVLALASLNFPVYEVSENLTNNVARLKGRDMQTYRLPSWALRDAGFGAYASIKLEPAERVYSTFVRREQLKALGNGFYLGNENYAYEDGEIWRTTVRAENSFKEDGFTLVIEIPWGGKYDNSPSHAIARERVEWIAEHLVFDEGELAAYYQESLEAAIDDAEQRR